MGRRLKEDLTFKSLNGLFIFGITYCKKNLRQMWKVRCHCGSIRPPMTYTNINKYRNNGMCRCPSKYRIAGNSVYVDCSTTKFPNKECILDKEVFEEYYQGEVLSSYQSGNSDLVYVSCRGSPVHSLVNKTPKGLCTDHISGNTLDNRKSNLRSVSKKENGRNCRVNTDNSPGVCGVSFRKDTSKWSAKITVDCKVIYLGTCYETFEDAVKARKLAEIQYGFHENHGRDR